MKVLQILPELNIGGVERGTVDLARKLQACGHQALVVSRGGRLTQQLESYGARHICLPVHKKSLFSILTNITKLSRILQEEQVDIVHARSRIPALIAYFACRRTATLFLTTCHGYYSQNIFSRVMGWGKRVIVSSSAVARHMREDFGVPQERLRFIPRGVDLQEFKFCPKAQSRNQSPATFTIGVIGRLSPIKGHQYFLQALAQVIRVLPRVRALIVGDISPGKERYKEELRMLCRRLSLDGYVQFTGHQENIPHVLSQLDVLVLPTVTEEAFGRVLIEAGACGVPVIATKVGGIVDIIQDGVNGILVEPKNPGELAQALVRLFGDAQLSRRLVLAARRRVEEDFSLEQMAERTMRVYEELKATLKILVIKLSALGDVILAIPSLRALREKFPWAHITVLVGAPFRSILQNCPYVDRIIELPGKSKGLKDIWRLSAQLRRLDFDIVVDLQNNRCSHLLAYLSGCNRRYGYDNGKLSFLLNRRVKEMSSPLSPIAHQTRSLKLLGIKTLKESLQLWPDEQDELWAEEFLREHSSKKNGPLIGINLGASSAWPSKRWAVEKFAALLDRMNTAGWQVVVTGKGKDKELVQRLRQLCRSPFIDAVEKTQILQLACLIRRLDVYITGDSAPLHIAYAMHTPVVALFGPTDPLRHTITGAQQMVIKKEEACSPCYKRHCGKHHCMQRISVEEVFAAVEQLSREKEGGKRRE